MATSTKSNVNSGKKKTGKSFAGKSPAGKTGLKENPNLKRTGTTASIKATSAAKPKKPIVKNTTDVTNVKPQRTDLNLAHFRELLIEERKRLEEELEQVRNRHTDMENALPEEGEGGDEDTADLASAMMDKEMDLSVEDEIEDILSHVDRALQKLEEGTYGICDVSGNEIPINRLEAIPYATLTIECQSLSEG
jgi:DnaK suppressor protein